MDEANDCKTENAGEGGVADNSVEETREIRAGEARKTLAGEGGVADNSVEETREVRAGGARKIFYLKQKKLLKKEARLSSMKPSPN